MYALRVPPWFSKRYPNIYAALQHNRLYTVSDYDWQRTFEELTIPNRLQVGIYKAFVLKNRFFRLLKPLSHGSKCCRNCRICYKKRSAPNRSSCLFSEIVVARRCAICHQVKAHTKSSARYSIMVLCLHGTS